ncbi:hypothetical protein CDAR_45721 [Caerostris darwini]|uniref:Uncharacterized protein n=1 Tax=Caerostris darwini TaxID=1538125 RepID=A0AAV4N3W7_9ARAC|nr:hypothetical protein CDAR_45721 [Caerostris darwini]
MCPRLRLTYSTYSSKSILLPLPTLSPYPIPNSKVREIESSFRHPDVQQNILAYRSTMPVSNTDMENQRTIHHTTPAILYHSSKLIKK